MPSYGTFKVTDRKCATCNFYQGARRIGLQVNKPFYVHADSGSTPCQAQPARRVTPTDQCPAWQKWVSLAGG